MIGYDPLLVEQSEARAVSIRYFNLYRLVVASAFAIFGSAMVIGRNNSPLFETTILGYWLLAMFFAVLQMRSELAAERLIGAQVALDILVLTTLMYASGGNRSGVPFVMMTFVAGAGLVGRGRMVLGAASFATLALLVEQGIRMLAGDEDSVDYSRTGVICVGIFFVAIVARYLAQRALLNEAIAVTRGRDLERQQHVNACIIEALPDGVVVVDALGLLRHANPCAAQWLGVKLEAGQALSEVAPGLHAAFKTKASELYVDSTGKKLCLRVTPIASAGDTVLYLEDSDRMQAQAQQIKLAALGRLTANIAHEIRNPLSAVSHAADLMVEEKRANVQARLVRIIHDNSARIERIVRDVLELGRRDRGTLEALPIGAFVTQFMDESCTHFAIPPGTIQMTQDVSASVWFDRVHLYQILSNLIGNAARYCSKAPGSIRIQLRARDDHRVSIVIADDGPGIAPDDRIKVFEPFFTSDPKGTGLGLYTARELAEANGATLNLVDSAHGAEFHLVARRVE